MGLRPWGPGETPAWTFSYINVISFNFYGKYIYKYYIYLKNIKYCIYL